MKKIKKYSISDIQKLKYKNFATVTAYDFPTAQIIDQLNIPIILVGDSASMVVYGYKNTTTITMDELLLLTKAVSRATSKALIVGDMPFMSYQPSTQHAIQNAGRFIKEGKVDAIKLEGGIEYIKQIKSIIKAGIPVMGHIGLKPQSVLQQSGYKIQGKKADTAIQIYNDACALEQAGVFSIVLEGIPEELAQLITEKIKIPTIGIGAGKFCDGQIQVVHDLIGLLGKTIPKHASLYLNMKEKIKNALEQYQIDVKNNQFPKIDNTFNMNQQELMKLKNKIESL